MKRSSLLFSLWLVLLGMTLSVTAPAATLGDRRKQADKSMKDGNWNDALKVFRELTTDAGNAGEPLSQDLNKAVQCVQNLGKYTLWDAVVEEAVRAHPKDWRLLKEAATLYQSTQPWGTIVSGEFQRGQYAGGKQVSSAQRDRVRSLQLFQEALKTIQGTNESAEVKAAFYEFFATSMAGVEGWNYRR